MIETQRLVCWRRYRADVSSEHENTTSAWQEHEIDIVLSKRLGERKERYFENLREMSETMVKLGKVSRALDKDFQASLEQNTQVGNAYVYGHIVKHWRRNTDVFSLNRSVTLSHMPPVEQC